jgi:F-type H+-transporting ATPase subunit b
VEVLNQLGKLFLAAVPTVIFIFLFYLFLRWSFFAPIERVLEERQKRTEGARQESESLHAAAQDKHRSYKEALQRARGDIFAEQESSRRVALEERQRVINAARLAAQQELQAKKKSLAAEVEAARAQLEQSSAGLAAEIAEAILAGGSPDPGSLGRGETP